MFPPSFAKRMIHLVVWLLGFAATAYLALVLALFVGQRHLLYHTAGHLPEPPAPFQAVSVPTSDGLSLTAWYAPPAQPKGLVVLMLHGNAGTIAGREDKARHFLKAGHGVLLLEYRGFAGLPGRPSEDGLLEDGRGALRWLAGQAVPVSRVVLYGESLGTGVAVGLASATTPAAVILEAPYTSAADVAALQYPYVPVHWLMLDPFDSLARIGRITAPLLIIHGQRDGLIPVAQARRLFAAAPEPKRLKIMEQAGHNDLFAWGAGEGMGEFLAGLPGML